MKLNRGIEFQIVCCFIRFGYKELKNRFTIHIPCCRSVLKVDEVIYARHYALGPI